MVRRERCRSDQPSRTVATAGIVEAEIPRRKMIRIEDMVGVVYWQRQRAELTLAKSFASWPPALIVAVIVCPVDVLSLHACAQL